MVEATILRLLIIFPKETCVTAYLFTLAPTVRVIAVVGYCGSDPCILYIYAAVRAAVDRMIRDMD